MKYRELKYLVASDCHRLEGSSGRGAIWKNFFRSITFRYSVLWRWRGYLKRHPVFRFGFYRIIQFFVTRYTYKLGIRIPQETKIGPGFYIGHWGSIFVNRDAVIGSNCNISQCVTLGGMAHGENKGAPVIGDNVYIGPGATLVGSIKVGDNALIGANSLILTDVPENAVMMGVPAKAFSRSGSTGYINHTDYPQPDPPFPDDQLPDPKSL